MFIQKGLPWWSCWLHLCHTSEGLCGLCAIITRVKCFKQYLFKRNTILQRFLSHPSAGRRSRSSKIKQHQGTEMKEKPSGLRPVPKLGQASNFERHSWFNEGFIHVNPLYQCSCLYIFPVEGMVDLFFLGHMNLYPEHSVWVPEWDNRRKFRTSSSQRFVHE